jgi:hypothetical protein
MEFNLDFLRQTGEALSSFGKKDEDKIIDYSNTDAEDDKSTQESVTPIVLDKSADEKTVDESTTEVIQTKTEKEKKEDTEDSLEKKLKNIEKVIETFGSKPTTLPSGKLPSSNINADINQRPLDMGQVQAKAAQADYLKASTVPEDRIALLYEDLKKYNLI